MSMILLSSVQKSNQNQQTPGAATTAQKRVKHKAAQPAPSQHHHVSQSSFAPRQLSASPSMYKTAHAGHGATLVQSPVALQRTQLHFQTLSSHATAASPGTAPLFESAAAISVPEKALYACQPPGRPAGRRCAIRRWVLTQRALWDENQLASIQMQFMTNLGKHSPTRVPHPSLQHRIHCLVEARIHNLRMSLCIN